MILSFKCKESEKIFLRIGSKKFSPDLNKLALRKLLMLHASTSLEMLRVPPSNFLEKLRGERQGQWSIRVNRQWRVCFIWTGTDAKDVEIVDYH